MITTNSYSLRQSESAAIFNIIFIADDGGNLFTLDWTGAMAAKLVNEVLPSAIYHMEVSDTDTEILAATPATLNYIAFYKYNGAFTADGTVPTVTFNNINEGLIKISTVTYFAYFHQSDP